MCPSISTVQPLETLCVCLAQCLKKIHNRKKKFISEIVKGINSKPDLQTKKQPGLGHIPLELDSFYRHKNWILGTLPYTVT